MALRPLLTRLAEHPDGAALIADGGRAFVSQSMRPYLVAALADGTAADRPTLVVAGDDRQARDLAADLRAWLEPRPVRFYPSRGVAYESHLAPPPHLVGLRVAALDALVRGEGAPVVVASAVALSEKVPDPALRPQGLRLARGDLVDLDELAADLVAAGYERVEQVDDRGQFAVRGGLLDLYPATEERAVRVDLFDIQIESLRWFSTFTQRSLGEAEVVEIAPAAELAPEHRELAEIAALEDAGEQPVEFQAQSADTAARSVRDAEPELEKLVRSGYRTVVTWPRRGEGERAAFNLERVTPEWLGDAAAPGGGLSFATASLRDGFVAAGLQLAVIPAHRLVRRRRAERQERPRRGALRSFADLRTGDIVVHEDHGVARFAGFDTKTVAGVTRDYLDLEYAGTDKVFLPVDQLAKISRYVGAGGSHPPLSKLGGKAWEAMKARARRAAQELAGELLNLYAERRRRTGHSFAEDGEWLRDFEARWPYQETADQREAIEAVKADMERDQPMDRLICGDVGYGKTEVALRAAFKAADDGKQVLVLAPTTILAQQHYGNFAERLKDYPFTVDHVSRFRTPKEQKEVVAAFNEGKVDILIGTHRLLGRDMRGKDIGLIIVDEEQRFGVKQKELLRQLKLKVDVIAMSATPIPRTLQMSLAGLREISVIETPPVGRRPVKTFVGDYDEDLVKQAIMREKHRGGQAFFVHNRVDTIDETAERLRGLCPGVRFEVAHGQLDEKQLEERMLTFLRGEADVLVATSIIESGIDIPQANTLIVERSDLFGLAQLYQIRGRVGRSRERAYAYLLYPSSFALTEEATKRLSALSDYTELGAGFKIAMRDLEIRGAGNLLGDEQSGHVAALGFELYLAMLDEAVRGMDGTLGDDEPEPVRLDVNVDAYVPADYVPYEQAKVDVHRRVAAARDVADLALLRDELEDRFGPVPEPLENLIALQQARIKFGRAGARMVSFRGEMLAATPLELTSDQAQELRERVAEARYEPGRSQVSFRVPRDAEARFRIVVAAADALLAVTAPVGDLTAA